MIVLLAAAWAGESAVLVLPASGGPDEQALRRAADAAELGPVRSLGAGAFVRGVEHLPMPRALGPDCAGPVQLADWRARLGAAQRRFDLFDTEGALSDLLLLDAQLECAAAPLPARDVFTLDVARAEAHLLLADASAQADDEQAAFHRQQAAGALDRAVASAPDRYPEAASPELVDALEEARGRREAGAGPWLAVVGVEPDEEAWINGEEVRRVARAPAGDSIVLRVKDGEVVGARRVHLGPDESAILDFAGGEAPLGELVAALVRKAPSRLDQERLAALALLRGGGDVVLYAGWVGGSPVAWQAVDADLVRLDVPPERPEPDAVGDSDLPADDPPLGREPPRREPSPPVRPPDRGVRTSERRFGPAEVDAWRATAGVVMGGGWRSQGVGSVEVGLGGRVALAPRWALAWSVTPAGDTATLDPSGAGLQVEVPVRLGGRWGAHNRAGHPELGVDLGVRLADTPVPLTGLCGAWAGGAGPAGGARLELCAETDLAGVGVRAGVSVESWI